MPRDWADEVDRLAAMWIRKSARFHEVWQLAMSQVRAARNAGFGVTAMVADGDYGSTAAFRLGRERMDVPCAVAILWSTAAVGTRPRNR